MGRGIKIALLVVIAVPLALVLLVATWLGTLWIAETLKLGWVEVPVHYRLTFGVEVGGINYRGSTVVQVTYQSIPQWQLLTTVPGIAALYRGQASCLKLPDGKAVCLLASDQYPVRGKNRYSVAAIAARLLSVDGSPTGPKEKWKGIHASNAATVSGSSNIQIDLLPTMIVFDDSMNPRSAHLFDAEHPETTLGSGSRFNGAEIAVTGDPVSHDIEVVLPWLADHPSNLAQQLSWPGDPIHRENPGSPLYKAYFY
jgi:hypothetical protein